MSSTQKMGAAWIGMALFSMFFGSGNVVFPLVVGKVAEDQFLYATCGFLATAVLMPLLGIIAMVLYEGDYNRFFGRLGGKLGFWVSALILTVWIPLGSGPRCIAVAFGSIKYYTPDLPIWVFSLISGVLIHFLTHGRRQIVRLLGYFLTPALLTALLLIIGVGIWEAASFSASEMQPLEAAWMGAQEGYNTMDLIASFFFCSTVIIAIQKQTEGAPKRTQLLHALKSCCIGALLLSVVYVGFLYIAAAYSPALDGVPKQEVLPSLAMLIMGTKMRFVATAVITLSCLTTVITLVYVYAEFLQHTVFKGKYSMPSCILMTNLLTVALSILDFEGISALVGPILWWCYPPLILLLVVNLSLNVYSAMKQR